MIFLFFFFFFFFFFFLGGGGGIFIENDENVTQSCLKVIAKCSFVYILCVFWKVRTVSVEIGRIDLGRSLFTNFGPNV